MEAVEPVEPDLWLQDLFSLRLLSKKSAAFSKLL